MTGRLITRAQWIQSPWRNGLGVTQVIWPQPKADDFAGLHIHRTPITQAGPFSLYDGFERILTLVGGDGLALSIDGVRAPLVPFSPLRFAGEAIVESHLSAGPVEVFNVIYARNQWQEAPASTGGGVTIVHRLDQSVSILDANGTKRLAEADTFLVECAIATDPPTGSFVRIHLERRPGSIPSR